MTDNYFAPVVCHWICTNPACSENGVLKDGYIYDPPAGIVATCGVCSRNCVKQDLPVAQQLPVFPEEETT